MATQATCFDSTDSTVSLKLTGVHGDGDKNNDVYVFGSLDNCTEHIIFFGGDIQDYENNMQGHDTNKAYVRWSTENTARLLHKKFASSLIFVIKPTYMHLQTFSVYSNFFLNEDASPIHSSDFGAIRHLFLLYNSAVEQVYSTSKLTVPSSSLPVCLIGFSKGCCVLNQIVLELHLLDHYPELKKFLECVKAFYWLDGGHAGGEDNTWITHDDSLQRLAALDSQIFIHVTPYQILDREREWIGPQEIQFYHKLLNFKAKVVEQFHFAQEPASITKHFKLLEIF